MTTADSKRMLRAGNSDGIGLVRPCELLAGGHQLCSISLSPLPDGLGIRLVESGVADCAIYP